MNHLTLEEKKQFMTRFVDETINKQNLDAVDALVAADFVEHIPFPGQGPGPQGLKHAIGSILAGFPDTHWTIDEQVAEGDTVMSRFTWTGTHLGDFLGVPATKKDIRVWGIVIDVVRDGKFSESRLIMDMPALMQQIGVGA